MQTFDRVAIKAEARRILSLNRGPCAGAFLAIFLVQLMLTSLSAGVLGLLASGVLMVGEAFFFLSMWRERPIPVGEMFTSLFDVGFLRKMGGMLWMEFKVFLWSLLLVVPGIIKAVGYAMTPYILAEYPDVPAMEASRLSERMMMGHKAELFITELSFLGWILLSALTFGILEVVHVGPYVYLTYAGIYDEVKRLALESGAIRPEELEGQILS